MEPYSRPQSVINIISIPDATQSNPQPLSDADKSFGEFISFQKLKEVSGCSDLKEVVELKMKVDSAETSIGNIGSMAPNITTLNLNNSYITSVRDLGTNLNQLNTLWLSRCCLAELDGISSLAGLKELYLAYNEIFDISPLSMLENLQVLDLEGNNIDDITQVEFLLLCTKLNDLTLKGNPLEKSPSPTTNTKDLKFYSYREAVLRCLPQLDVLDDQPFTMQKVNGEYIKVDQPETSPPPSSEHVYTQDLQVIHESLKSLEVEDEINGSREEECEFSRPSTARKREGSSKRTSASSNSDSPNHPAFTVSPSLLEEDESENSSSLTHGGVMCGNPVAALRLRSKTKNIKKRVEVNNTDSIFKAEHTYPSPTPSDYHQDHHDLLEELKQWRLQNDRLFEENNISVPNEHTIKRNHRVISNSDSSSPTFSPTPPSISKPCRQSSRVRRSLPPASKHTENFDDFRPHTSADFRLRKYQVISPDMGYQESSLSSPHTLEDMEDEAQLNQPQSNNRTIPEISNNNNIYDLSKRPTTARAALHLTPLTSNRCSKDDGSDS